MRQASLEENYGREHPFELPPLASIPLHILFILLLLSHLSLHFGLYTQGPSCSQMAGRAAPNRQPR